MSQKSEKSVLFIAPQPFFENRGTPFNVKAMAEVLSAEGYQVELLVYPYGREIEIPKVKISRSFALPFVSKVPIGFSFTKFFLDIPLFIKAFSLAKKNSYSVIHGIEEGGIMAGIISRLTKTPYVYDMDSSMPEQIAKKLFLGSFFAESILNKIETYFIENSLAVLTVCEALSDKARSLSAKAKVAQIEDFPIEQPVINGQRETIRISEEFSLAKKRLILYTGNFESYQGIDLLVTSFARYLAENPDDRDTHLLLVGGGELDSSMVLKYKSFAEEHKVLERVIFTGKRPVEEMPVFMDLADVLASPRSVGENTPLKLYSYMASGKPIVATKLRTHTQVLDDTTAYLTEPNAQDYAKKLAEALCLSADSLEKRLKIVLSAKELVQKSYSREAFSRRLRELYLEIIGSPSLDTQLNSRMVVG